MTDFLKNLLHMPGLFKAHTRPGEYIPEEPSGIKTVGFIEIPDMIQSLFDCIRQIFNYFPAYGGQTGLSSLHFLR